MTRFALFVCLAAPLASAQTLPAAPQPYVRASAGVGGVEYRVDRARAGGESSTEMANAFAASVEVGVPVAPTSVLGLGGPQTLGIEVSVARAETGTLQAPFGGTDVSPLAVWQSSVVVTSRSQLSAGPLDVSSGLGIGVGYSASVEWSATGRGDIQSGLPIFDYESRRTHRVAPLLHIDVALGHTFGSTFVGIGSTIRTGLVPGVSAGGGSRLGLDVQRTF